MEFYQFYGQNECSDSRWKFWLARLFGQKNIGGDEHAGRAYEIVSYLWRGKYYVWEVKEATIGE